MPYRHPELDGGLEVIEDGAPLAFIVGAAAMALVHDDKVKEGGATLPEGWRILADNFYSLTLFAVLTSQTPWLGFTCRDSFRLVRPHERLEDGEEQRSMPQKPTPLLGVGEADGEVAGVLLRLQHNTAGSDRDHAVVT